MEENGTEPLEGSGTVQERGANPPSDGGKVQGIKANRLSGGGKGPFGGNGGGSLTGSEIVPPQRRRIILTHWDRCPERGEIGIKITLEETDMEIRQAMRRQNRRRDYKPPMYLKKGYTCPLSKDCETVRDDPDACPLYRDFHYPSLTD